MHVYMHVWITKFVCIYLSLYIYKERENEKDRYGHI